MSLVQNNSHTTGVNFAVVFSSSTAGATSSPSLPYSLSSASVAVDTATGATGVLSFPSVGAMWRCSFVTHYDAVFE